MPQTLPYAVDSLITLQREIQIRFLSNVCIVLNTDKLLFVQQRISGRKQPQIINRMKFHTRVS
jgi:hypothetical protein